jgi:hypothetical protein
LARAKRAAAPPAWACRPVRPRRAG